jgi:hypothetical protein
VTAGVQASRGEGLAALEGSMAAGEWVRAPTEGRVEQWEEEGEKRGSIDLCSSGSMCETLAWGRGVGGAWGGDRKY